MVICEICFLPMKRVMTRRVRKATTERINIRTTSGNGEPSPVSFWLVWDMLGKKMPAARERRPDLQGRSVILHAGLWLSVLLTATPLLVGSGGEQAALPGGQPMHRLINELE